MPESFTGLVRFQNSDGVTIVVINPNADAASEEVLNIVGANGVGVLLKFTQDGKLSLGGSGIMLNGEDASIQVGSFITPPGDGAIRIWPGIHLSGGDNPPSASDLVRVHIDGGAGDITLGGPDRNGDIKLRQEGGSGRIRVHLSGGASVPSADVRVHIDGDAGDITLGGPGVNGDIKLREEGGSGRIRVHLSGGDSVPSDDVRVHVNGDTGDIILQNADAAEDFDLATPELIDAGTVVVLDENSKLKPCEQGYDNRAAGVISGAGGLRPGMILGRDPSQKDRLPLALVGKVYCKVDAQFGSIRVGDLLTTSPNLGHAMKATDPVRAFGSVIGKALKPLSEGSGLIPILIALQ